MSGANPVLAGESPADSGESPADRAAGGPSPKPSPLGGTPGSLKRYRVMALTVGTGLALLCFVGIPLQVAGHYADHVHGSVLASRWPWSSVVEVVGPIHGIFYIIYLISCLDLAGRARLRTVQLLGMVGAGLLPVLAFVMERVVVRQVEAQLALGPDAPPGPVATVWAVISGRARAEVAAGQEPSGPGPGER